MPSSNIIDIMFKLLSNFRCIFNADVSGKQELPEMTLDSTEFIQLQKSDLVMNVYRDGVWGSFRHMSLQTGESH